LDLQSGLLPSVAQQTHFTGTLDFAGQLSLVFGAAAGFFAWQNLILSTDEMAQYVGIAESDRLDLFSTENTNEV
jgi:hypothetical protein